MGKSESGPDMQDCSTLAHHLEQDWALSVTILLELDGSSGGYGWRIHGLGVPRQPRLLRDEPGVAATVTWPHRDHKTFEGAVFALLHRMDKLLADADWGGPTSKT